MEMEKIIELNEQNIRQALKDYGAHVYHSRILEDVSDEFIRRLAADSARSKRELRELFEKSPVWDEKLQALVINGTRTHDPDSSLIYDLAINMLRPAAGTVAGLSYNDVTNIAGFFSENYSYEQSSGSSEVSDTDKQILETRRSARIEIINRVAPKAYAPGKKLSRVFKAICDALKVSDDTAGSEFQKLYAQFADELTAKKIGFKLYISINPAHFLTMSNPKDDDRGSTLTSCHSFNSTEYPYNNGCSGYARDKYTFIAFTVSDPADPETFNNRKTTRQIFAYKPGNGLLMQSRLYNTSGGTRGAQAESKLYRDLIQREISALEEVPNLWKTSPYLGGKENCVEVGYGFGGYADWTYTDFEGKVSIRSDHKNDFVPLTVGTYGLCIRCGDENEDGLYCNECRDDNICDECGEHFSGELNSAYDCHGNRIYVCDECLDEYFRCCEECGEYHPVDYCHWVDDRDGYVCDSCYDEYYECCDDCDEMYHRDRLYDAYDSQGHDIRICENCRDRDYIECEECDVYTHSDFISTVLDEDNDIHYLCGACTETVASECVDCRQLYLNRALNAEHRCANCAEKVEEANAEEETAV